MRKSVFFAGLQALGASMEQQRGSTSFPVRTFHQFLENNPSPIPSPSSAFIAGLSNGQHGYDVSLGMYHRLEETSDLVVTRDLSAGKRGSRLVLREEHAPTAVCSRSCCSSCVGHASRRQG